MQVIDKIGINSGGLWICSPEWYWDSPIFKDHVLWYPYAGKGSIRYRGGASYEIDGRTAFLMRPGERVVGRHDPENPLKVYAFHFDFSSESGARLALPSNCRIGEILTFHKLFVEAHDSYQYGKKETAEFWLKAALLQLYKQCEHKKRDDLVVDMLLQAIVREPEKAYKVEELAVSSGYSADHLSRRFRRASGKSLQQFIVHTRIEKAKALLLNSNYSLQQISLRCGYEDHCYFSRLFKKKVGQPPGRFRG